MWKRVNNLNDCRALYELVTPADDRKEDIIIRLPDQYGAYVLKEDAKVIAFGCVGVLKGATVIDLFALDPSIRGQRRAKPIFHSFLSHLQENSIAVDRLMLEAYLYNIEPWCKIMEMEPSQCQLMSKHTKSAVKLLTRGIPVDEQESVYKEWQEFQEQW
jgi:hypothetical protein